MTKNDIKENGDLIINKAKVKDINNNYIIKGTKTEKSNRVIKIDVRLANQIIKNDYVINITYRQFYQNFIRILKKLN